MKRIQQIGVPVKNIQRSTAFYRDVLQLPVLFELGTMVFIQCGDVRLMLTLPETEAFDHPSSVLYFEVDSLQAEYDRMKEQGVVFLGEPHRITRSETEETWMAFFKDSEQNTLALTAQVAVTI